MARNTSRYAYHEVAIPRDSPAYRRLLEEARKRRTGVGKLLNLLLPIILEEVPDLWNPTALPVVPPADQSSDKERQQEAGGLHDNPAARALADSLGLLEDDDNNA